MKEIILQQAEQHIQHFFQEAKLSKKKWCREIHNFDHLLYSFFVIRRRMIQPKSYTIHEAKGISYQLLKPELLRDYTELKNILTNKGDLKKYHTENSKILYPIDSLLEEWNINHLHIDRSRYQVFFMEIDTHIFIINICKHFERNRTSYSKNSLLKIIEENWPEKLFHNRNYLDKHPIYTSVYGWEKVQQFYDWIENIPFQEKQGIVLSFLNNEQFVVKTMYSEQEVAWLAV